MRKTLFLTLFFLFLLFSSKSFMPTNISWALKGQGQGGYLATDLSIDLRGISCEK